MSFNLNMCILNKNISQITIPKTDFYLREELELFEYPSKCSLPSQHFRHHCHYCHCQFVVASSSSSSSTLRKSLWLLNGGGSSGRSLLSLGRAQELTEAPQSWFIPPLLYKFLNIHTVYYTVPRSFANSCAKILYIFVILLIIFTPGLSSCHRSFIS